YSYIHPERKHLILIIKETESHNGHISQLMGMSTPTIRHSLQYNRIYGDVIPPPKGQVGQPRTHEWSRQLSQYLKGFIECRPDAMLAELRTDLCAGMGIDMDGSTI
ncbi:hypothetical protein B0H14DRAFT_2280741, partial [Mycena olivaceomarginata]